jgi:hypothetical protein
MLRRMDCFDFQLNGYEGANLSPSSIQVLTKFTQEPGLAHSSILRSKIQTVRAVEDAFDIREGEMSGFLANGAGKTTALKFSRPAISDQRRSERKRISVVRAQTGISSADPSRDGPEKPAHLGLACK